MRHSAHRPYPAFFLFTIPPPPRSTLFPYTTLFRSSKTRLRRRTSPRRVRPRSVRPPALHAPRPSRLRRSEEHTSELQSRQYLVCRLLLEKKNGTNPPRSQARPQTASTRIPHHGSRS